MSICHKFLSGRCPFGKNCRFIHQERVYYTVGHSKMSNFVPFAGKWKDVKQAIIRTSTRETKNKDIIAKNELGIQLVDTDVLMHGQHINIKYISKEHVNIERSAMQTLKETCDKLKFVRMSESFVRQTEATFDKRWKCDISIKTKYLLEVYTAVGKDKSEAKTIASAIALDKCYFLRLYEVVPKEKISVSFENMNEEEAIQHLINMAEYIPFEGSCYGRVDKHIRSIIRSGQQEIDEDDIVFTLNQLKIE